MAGLSQLGGAQRDAIAGDTSSAAQMHQATGPRPMAVSREAGMAESIARIGERWGGSRKVIQEAWELTGAPLKEPETFARVGIEPPNGLLLVGPPGTGKTLLARSIAEEAGAHFIEMKGAEAFTAYFGESGQNIRKFFDEAKANAPTIIFVDELDGVAPAREGMSGNSQGFYSEVVGQFLTQVGDLKPEDRVRLIGATNLPDALDPAARRPGRFDREIYVGTPDEAGLNQILGIHTKNMKLTRGVSLPAIAKRIRGFVGADVKKLVTEAGMQAVRRLLDMGDSADETAKVARGIDIVDLQKLEKAFPKEVEASVSAQGKFRFDIPEEVAHKLPEEVVSSFLNFLDQEEEAVLAASEFHSGDFSYTLSRNELETFANRWLESVEEDPEMMRTLFAAFPRTVKADVSTTVHDFEVALAEVKPSATRQGDIQISTVTWDDIAGNADVKEEIQDRVALPLAHPDLFTRLGAKPETQHVLIVGEPGNAKTQFLLAAANELNANVFPLKVADLRGGAQGDAAKAIKAVFTRARSTEPAIIAVDEIDALLPVRGAGSHEDDTIVNAFLTEMQGLQDNDRVIVIGTSNRPDMIDPALRRSGRFGEPIVINNPDAETRAAIFDTKIKPLKVGKGVDTTKLAARTEGLSGADITDIVRQAVLITVKNYSTRKSIPAVAFDQAVDKFLAARAKAGTTKQTIGFRIPE